MKKMRIFCNFPCHDDSEDCEDLIVEGIKSKHVKLVENDDDDESPVHVPNQDTKNYMAAKGPISDLNICADFIQEKCKKNIKQTILESFLMYLLNISINFIK